MTRPSTIAIDGPAASGKTTLARRLAAVLGYLYLDTGMMYRAVTLAALERGVDTGDGSALTALAESLTIDVRPGAGTEMASSALILDGVDVSARLRDPEVDAHVSAVSAVKGVRDAMTAQQRRIGGRTHVVMVGRDIGTVVLPDADLKIFLKASVEERARRRWRESRQSGLDESYEAVLDSMRARDARDAGRAVAPMRAAHDAVVIDTTDKDTQQVLAEVLALVGYEEEGNGAL